MKVKDTISRFLGKTVGLLIFAKRPGRGFKYLIMVGIVAMAVSPAGSRTWAQGAAEPSLDQVFEEAFAAVAGITDPSSRIYGARSLGETDVNYGGKRLEARLIPLLKSTLEEIPADSQASSLAYAAVAFALYGQTSELLGVMRDLNDAWNRGGRALKILAEKDDVATALILAERESKPARRFIALTHIVHGLAESGKTREAREIFDQAQSVYGSLSETSKNTYVGHYLAAMAHFDLRQAERLALGLKRDHDRDSAILQLTRVVANRDPERALEMALKINSETYRGYAVNNVIRATEQNPDRRRIYQQALAKADPLGRAYAFRKAAGHALANGELVRAGEALDQLDAMLPELGEKDQARVSDRVVTRLAIELVSGDVDQVFEKMESLTYGDNLKKDTAVWIIANALRANGHYDLGRRVAETIPGTTNHAGYFVAAINARFE